MVNLTIGGQKVQRIISLELDNDLEKPVSLLQASMPPSVEFCIGEYVELSIDKKIVFKGILEAFSHEINSAEEIKQISCRSLTHLLVDTCVEPKVWPNKKSIKSLLKEIVNPLGLELKTENLNENITKPFVVSAGETVFDIIERLLQPLGHLICTEVGSDIKIFKGADKGKILSPTKIISYNYNKDISSQFNKVIVLGQEKEKPIKQIAKEPKINPKKVLVLYEDGKSDELKKIAQWQVRVREARSENLVIQTSEQNSFIPGNTLRYKEREWLIATVNLKSDTNGFIYTLGLKKKGAYETNH